MMISGHWEIPGFETNKQVRPEDLGVTSVPSNLAQPVTVYYAKSFAIPVQSRNPELAWKYLRYVTSRPFQMEYQTTGIAVCGRRDVASALGTDPLNRAFQKLIPSARPPWGAKVIGYDFVEQEGVKMMQSALLGVPPKHALKQMAERVDAYFKVR
jgi:multiple sugar transport system substrate-binding protein